MTRLIIKINATNSNSRVSKALDDSFGALTTFFLYILILALTSRIWTKFGLVSGANGSLRDIIVDLITNAPHTILVQLENYSGPYFFPETDPKHKWIPINPVTGYNPSLKGSRTQFAIRSAYGVTIHKSQGQTLDKVVIDIGKNERSLEALSRVKNFNDSLIEPFPLEKLNKIKNFISLKHRINEKEILDKIVNKTFVIIC